MSSRILARFRRHLPEVLIHRGLVEARELAAETGWAVLVFPLLAEEIVTRLASVAGAATETLAVAA